MNEFPYAFVVVKGFWVVLHLRRDVSINVNCCEHVAGIVNL